MEKISSIVPRSRRVTATDLSTAAPVRPGVPGFGRPMGSSTVGEKDLRSTAQKAMAAHHQMNEQKRQAAITLEIVTDMTNRFFLNKTIAAPEAPTAVAPPVDSAPEVIAAENNIETSAEMVEDAQEYVPPGTYLDVSA